MTSASDLRVIHTFVFLCHPFFPKFHPFLSTLPVLQHGVLSFSVMLTFFLSFHQTRLFSPSQVWLIPLLSFVITLFFSSFTLLSWFSTLYFTLFKLSFLSKLFPMFELFLQMYVLHWHAGTYKTIKLTLPIIFILLGSIVDYMQANEMHRDFQSRVLR